MRILLAIAMGFLILAFFFKEVLGSSAFSALAAFISIAVSWIAIIKPEGTRRISEIVDNLPLLPPRARESIKVVANRVSRSSGITVIVALAILSTGLFSDAFVEVIQSFEEKGVATFSQEPIEIVGRFILSDPKTVIRVIHIGDLFITGTVPLFIVMGIQFGSRGVRIQFLRCLLASALGVILGHLILFLARWQFPWAQYELPRLLAIPLAALLVATVPTSLAITGNRIAFRLRRRKADDAESIDRQPNPTDRADV